MRVQARFAVPSLEEGVPTPTRRFAVWETNSGLPDVSREEDERPAERRLRDLRGRVEVARAVVSNTSGLEETLVRDWKKAAMFYARFGVTEEVFRHGVPRDNFGQGVNISIPVPCQVSWSTIPGSAF